MCKSKSKKELKGVGVEATNRSSREIIFLAAFSFVKRNAKKTCSTVKNVFRDEFWMFRSPVDVPKMTILQFVCLFRNQEHKNLSAGVLTVKLSCRRLQTYVTIRI